MGLEQDEFIQADPPPGRLGTLLAHRRLPTALALLAVLLALPALWVGWLADDHWHRMVLLQPPTFPDLEALAPESAWDLFAFLNGDPQRNRQLMDLGILPWWSYEGVRAAFWRPLASLTHWLDYALWPDHPAAMHAHSLFWFGLLVAAVALFYRRIMGLTAVAGLAALLYAIDDARGTPVGFLAHRNALLATLFGVLAVMAHDRWRRDGRRAGAVAGPVLLLISLLSAEAGVATMAYLVAHAIFLDRGRWRGRVMALLPYGAVVLAWRLIWTHLGYGVYRGAEFYVDPAAEPLRYAVAVLRRAPILLLGQWGLPPSEIALVPGLVNPRLLWLGAVAFLVLAGLVVASVLWKDAVARFWTVGMVLSLLPVCATLPADRLLQFVGLGAFGLMARFLHAVFAGGKSPADRRPCPTAGRQRVPCVALGAVFVLIHCVAGPVLLCVHAANPMGPKSLLEKFHVTVPMDRTVEQQDVVIVNIPVAMIAGYLQTMRALDGLPVPRHVRVLAPSSDAVQLRRTDPHTLVLRPDKGYLWWPFDEGFRSKEYPMTLGERVELSGLTVEVTALTDDGRPAEATFHFAVPLEDASLRWLQWDADHRAYVPFTPPPVGQTVRL